MLQIVGICDLGRAEPADQATIRTMLWRIRHRGPDRFGVFLDDHVALGSARLSIIDLDTGQQPIANEDRSQWIVFNRGGLQLPGTEMELGVEVTGSTPPRH